MLPALDECWAPGGPVLSIAAVVVCVGLGCESVSDTPTPPPVPAQPPAKATVRSPPKSASLPRSKPLARLTAGELKEIASHLDLLIYGWSSDQKEASRPGYRNTALSGRDSVGTNLSIWLRCEPDVDKWAEMLAAEGGRPEGQAVAIEGNCGLWVRAEGQGHHKRTDVAEQVLGDIQRLRARK
jgi:hypothetical protein